MYMASTWQAAVHWITESGTIEQPCIHTGGSVVKKKICLPSGDKGSIPGWERFPRERNFSVLSWEIPWMEEPGRLQSLGLQKSWT